MIFYNFVKKWQTKNLTNFFVDAFSNFFVKWLSLGRFLKFQSHLVDNCLYFFRIFMKLSSIFTFCVVFFSKMFLSRFLWFSLHSLASTPECTYINRTYSGCCFIMFRCVVLCLVFFPVSILSYIWFKKLLKYIKLCTNIMFSVFISYFDFCSKKIYARAEFVYKA